MRVRVRVRARARARVVARTVTTAVAVVVAVAVMVRLCPRGSAAHPNTTIKQQSSGRKSCFGSAVAYLPQR